MSASRVDAASRVIRAEPSAIYGAFVDPAALVQWLPPHGMTGRIEIFEPRVGGEYRIVLTYDRRDESTRGKTTADADVVRGRFLELVSDERIVQSVVFESPDPRFAGDMTMTWRLERAADGTRVAITAENVPEGIAPADHQAGFAATLEKLAAFVER